MKPVRLPRLFCLSPKCCGHDMSIDHILDDIRRWPLARMVGPPSTPRRARPGRWRSLPDTEKRAAIARVKAGESVAAVAVAVGVSRMTIYNWMTRWTNEALA